MPDSDSHPVARVVRPVPVARGLPSPHFDAPTSWQLDSEALRVEPQVLSESILADPTPGIISFPIPHQPVRTVGCDFAPALATRTALPRPAERPGASPTALEPGSVAPVVDREPSPPTRTRIAPPSDVVKLADRFRYLLQPPLESLLASKSLQLAFEPFAHQLDGIAFLYPRQQAVLADEMGLGKTMQAVTAIRLLVHHGQANRILLICPKPLVTNWQREFAMWAPELPLTVLSGAQADRRWLWQRTEGLVAITNYETVVRDTEYTRLAQPFDLVVLDEAQRIKNPSGATSQAVCSIKRSRSWALTGTPIENSIQDLVGIFDYVAPGQLHETMKPRAMRAAIQDFVLRRTKDRVLTDLPPKLFRDAEIELSPEQHDAYQLAEQEGIIRLHELHDGLTIQHVFELVIRLKQICNFHPVSGASSKLQRLEADLEECAASGRKALVFSQWVGALNQLEERLARFQPLAYHGRIPSRQRDPILDEFRDNPDRHVLLMSYGAGGVGLNLQFAGYVFLFDRWWNPAVEDQAINRAHRIGAAGPVTVTRFLTPGTIEQRIDQILQEKRDLFDSVFAGDLKVRSRGLSRDEIFSLFQLPGRPDALPQAA